MQNLLIETSYKDTQKNDYLYNRLEELQIKDENNQIRVFNKDFPPQTLNYFSSDDNGNIKILYLTPNGYIGESAQSVPLIPRQSGPHIPQ